MHQREACMSRINKNVYNSEAGARHAKLRRLPSEKRMGYIVIDPAWKGDVAFYELVYGTWLVYGFLVLMWERGLRVRLPEWQYVLVTFLGASFFWVNHYFQNAPFYRALLNGYTAVFLVVYFLLCVRPQRRSKLWMAGATLTGLVFTVAFILFEHIPRIGVSRFGVNEFWFMLTAYFGFIAIIVWRGHARP
jgi:hypothetical protein